MPTAAQSGEPSPQFDCLLPKFSVIRMLRSALEIGRPMPTRSVRPASPFVKRMQFSWTITGATSLGWAP